MSRSEILWSSQVLVFSLLVGCNNKMNFSQNPLIPAGPVVEQPEEPLAPPTPPPPISLPEVELKSGTCNVGATTQLLSCLNCESTPAKPAPPILSRKGHELWDIMTAACSVPNKSDPRGYTAPTREQILKRLIQCSPTLYQDTNYESTQAFTIHALRYNPEAQKSAFGGLYYNWSSTDFETYFGLEISEARYTFCRGQSSFNNSGIYPKEYWDAWYEGQNYVLPPIWKKAQTIRNQLRNCMQESLRNPDVIQPPATPGVTCRFETAEGEISPQLLDIANRWFQNGKTVYYEGLGQCGIMDYPDSFLDADGKLKIAVKSCE